MHGNRRLQQLRAEGVIRSRAGRLALLDVARLRGTSEVNPASLHLAGGKRDEDQSTQPAST